MNPKFRYKTDHISGDSIDTHRYKNAINAYKRTKGFHYTKDEDYDESDFEGLSTEDYAKKYPIIYCDDGFIRNFKPNN